MFTQNIAHIFARSGRSLGKLCSKLRPKLRPPEVARQDKTKDKGGGLVTLDYHSLEQAICALRQGALVSGVWETDPEDGRENVHHLPELGEHTQRRHRPSVTLVTNIC